MGYVRKTRDEWTIQGCFGSRFGWEDCAAYDTRAEARADIREYRASGQGIYRLIKRRVPKEGTPVPALQEDTSMSTSGSVQHRRYTLQDVKRINIAAGRHFFDRSTMRGFGNTLRDIRVYHVREVSTGTQEIYLRVHNHNAPDGCDPINVWEFNPATGDIRHTNLSDSDLYQMRRHGFTAAFYSWLKAETYAQS